jgi:hypothetical protein
MREKLRRCGWLRLRQGRKPDGRDLWGSVHDGPARRPKAGRGRPHAYPEAAPDELSDAKERMAQEVLYQSAPTLAEQLYFVAEPLVAEPRPENR